MQKIITFENAQRKQGFKSTHHVVIDSIRSFGKLYYNIHKTGFQCYVSFKGCNDGDDLYMPEEDYERLLEIFEMEEQIMAKSKKYWVKIQKGFYNSKALEQIFALHNGHLMVMLYELMMNATIDNEGILQIEEGIPYTLKGLAVLTKYKNIDIIKSTLKTLEQYKLIETQKDGTIFFTQVLQMSGHTTEEAEKKAIYRKSKNEETTL